jgi:ABC-type multidrug transport system fused ATPase/permease subunit
MNLNFFSNTIKLSSISVFEIFKFSFISFVLSLLDLLSITLIGLLLIKNIFTKNLDTDLKLFSNIISFNINYVIIFLILIVFIKSLLLLYLNKKIFEFSNEKQHNLRLKLFKFFSKLDFLKFLQSSPNLYISLIGNHIKVLGSFISITIQYIGELFFLFLIIFLLVYINYKFTFFLLILFASVFFFLSKLKFLDSEKIGIDTKIAYKNLYSFVNNFFQSFKEIRTYNKISTINQNLKNYSTQLTKSDIKNNLVNIFPRLFLEFTATIFICFLFLFLFNFKTTVINFDNETELLSILMASVVRLLPFFTSSLRYLVNLKYSYTFINELIENVKYLQKFQEKKKKIINFNNKKISNISFKNVCYNYDDKIILQNLSIDMKIGQFIGIKGESGSGKSTLLNIICGLLINDKIEIYINNKKISNDQSITDLFAYVPQDKFLFEGEVWKNISLENDKKNCNFKKIDEVLKKVKLEYDKNYLLYNNGNNLSGGQKQRIVIARALYFAKKIIIFDESTNELDLIVEKEILNVFKKQKDIIVILVSHKEKTLSYCDKKFELRNNKLFPI